jgi:hypothetical protein
MLRGDQHSSASDLLDEKGTSRVYAWSPEEPHQDIPATGDVLRPKSAVLPSTQVRWCLVHCCCRRLVPSGSLTNGNMGTSEFSSSPFKCKEASLDVVACVFSGQAAQWQDLACLLD